MRLRPRMPWSAHVVYQAKRELFDVHSPTGHWSFSGRDATGQVGRANQSECAERIWPESTKPCLRTTRQNEPWPLNLELRIPPIRFAGWKGQGHRRAPERGPLWLNRFMTVAIITPYYKESTDILRRCRTSVINQSVRCRHYMVADGFPQDWIDGESDVSHIKLAHAHSDYGNTPRGIGALLAASEDAGQICFLDADNTIDADHVETCLYTAKKNPDCKFIVARRRFVFPDGTPVNVTEESVHVDTNCFFMLPGTFHLFSHLILQPKRMSPLGDRLFLAMLEFNKIKPAVCEKVTVTYTTNYLFHYNLAGKPAPSDAKPSFDIADLYDWWAMLPPHEKGKVQRNIGFPIDLS
jgi:hypothetical protein